jgi:nitric oxide dioxygenase
MVSNTLHSLPVGSDIQASFPAGTFIIPDPLPPHVIFLSAGVGITPNLAMLNSLVDLPKVPNITWIQGARNRVEHVFARHVRGIGEKCGKQFNEVVFYSRPGPPGPSGDGMGVKRVGKHRPGRVDLKALDRETLALQDAEALYYICGPPAFMSGMVQSLVELGVANDNIRFEAFAPGEIEMA